MPKNLNVLRRITIIDKCLQNSMHTPSTSLNPDDIGFWPMEDLLEKIDVQLSEYVSNYQGVSERTIRGDIKAMKSGELGYYAPIKCKANVGYYYDDPLFKITNNPINEEYTGKLKEALAILRQFRGFKYFEDLDAIAGSLEKKISHAELPMIAFDANPYARGLEFIESIRNSMKRKVPIGISYQPFLTPKIETVFHPYILKEYNNRWFVYGYSDIYNKDGVYALDRIQRVEMEKSIAFKNGDSKGITEYFHHIIGVTNMGNSIEDILIKVKTPRSLYIETKPIHVSQEIIEKNSEFTIFNYKLQINNELKALLLSFDCDLEVLKPVELRNELKHIISRMLALYR